MIFQEFPPQIQILDIWLSLRDFTMSSSGRKQYNIREAFRLTDFFLSNSENKLIFRSNFLRLENIFQNVTLAKKFINTWEREVMTENDGNQGNEIFSRGFDRFDKIWNELENDSGI